jgi:hypothetical protein
MLPSSNSHLHHTEQTPKVNGAELRKIGIY